MTKILLSFFLMLTFSCGNLSKNLVQKGTLTIKDGVVQDNVTHKKLRFTRTSWYYELTLVFDTLLTQVDEGNPFYGWFSPHMQKQIDKCPRFFVILFYGLDKNRIATADFLSQLRDLGHKEYIVNSFSQNFRLHPSYLNKSLDLYKVRGFCAPSKDLDTPIKFPGYLVKNIQ